MVFLAVSFQFKYTPVSEEITSEVILRQSVMVLKKNDELYTIQVTLR